MSTISPGALPRDPYRRRAPDWPRILGRMNRARRHLQRQGAVRPKPARNGTVRWVVRFRVRRRRGWMQRSIPLGSEPANVQQARQLLAQWQAERDPSRSDDPKIRHLWSCVQHYMLSVPRELRARCRAHFLPAFADPVAMPLAYLSWLAFLADWRRERKELRRRARR